MSKFLQSLVDSLAAVVVDDSICPEQTLEEGDYEEVGDMSDDLKRIFALREEIQRRNQEEATAVLHETIDQVGGGKRLDAAARQAVLESITAKKILIEERAERIKLLTNLLWAAVKFEFPELTGKSVSIGAGWKVGVREPEVISLRDLLAGHHGLAMAFA